MRGSMVERYAERQNAQILAALQSTEETLAVGEGITQELGRNREKLQAIGDKNEEVKRSLTYSERLAKRMQGRTGLMGLFR